MNQKIFKAGKEYISSIPQDYQTTVALSTKSNRKAPQEPESCCLPESMEQSQGPNLAPTIKPSKSPPLSHFTKLRMSARLNPPNKHPKIEQLIAVPTGKIIFNRQHLVSQSRTPTA